MPKRTIVDMHHFTCAMIPVLCLATCLTRGAPGGPATKPAGNGWDAKLFDYPRPAKLTVEESTPTLDQVAFLFRPPQLKADAPDPVDNGPARQRAFGTLSVLRLTFKDVDGNVVPALLCTPRGRKGPFPVVVAIHGLTSNKAQVCSQVAPSLAEHGFAVLAIDLPRHGERPGDPFSIFDFSRPDKSFAVYKQMVDDVRQLIDVAEKRPELDTRAGVTLVGYSLGSWVSAVTGPAEPRVRQMVLMVGGAQDTPVNLMAIPQIAACDPRMAIAHFAGRPILMLNGKADQIVKPDWAKRLYAAAPEPKSQVWYDSGHFLPAAAYRDAARWVGQTTGKEPAEQQKKAG